MIDVIIYIAVFILVSLAVGYILYQLGLFSSALSNSVENIAQQNKTAHDKTNLINHQIDHNLMRAKHISKQQAASTESLNKKVETILQDYETKGGNFKGSLASMRESLKQNLSTLEASIQQPIGAIQEALKANQNVLMTYTSKTEDIERQVQHQTKLFGEFKATLDSRTAELAALKTKFDAVESALLEAKREVENLRSTMDTMKTQLASFEELSNRMALLENKTSTFTKESHNDVMKVIHEYRNVLPRLMTLPTDYVTKSSFQRLEDRYKRDLPDLNAQVQTLNTKMTGDTEKDAEIEKTIAEFQTGLTQLKADIHQANALLGEASKIKDLEARVGDVDLASYKSGINLLPQLGSVFSRVGDVNIAQYKDQLPLLQKLPEALSQVGGADLTAYKDLFATLNNVPDLTSRMQSLTASVQKTEEELPNLGKILASLEELGKDLQSKMGNIREIQILKKFIEDHKAALAVKDGKLVANNSVCIEDVCMARDDLHRLVQPCPPC